MCGIAGAVWPPGEQPDRGILERMSQALQHRGPDDHGLFTFRNVGLVHRRLAILDLTEAGHQPMVNARGDLCLVYNGEIYNFREIRKDLEAVGYQFTSESDSEVLLNAWDFWGPGCLDQLNGMFAFAVLDMTESTIHLVRDRYGMKPLYWWNDGTRLAFASEQRGIKPFLTRSPELDKWGLAEYLTFQNIISNRTLSEGIHVVPPGTFLEIQLGDPLRITDHQYWDFEYEREADTGDHREYIEELDRLFNQSIARHGVSDVEVGSFLSGGLDSGMIAAVSATRGSPTKTFTIGFDEATEFSEFGRDERQSAQRVAERYSLQHYSRQISATSVKDSLATVADALEEPRVGQSYPNLFASQLASEHVKVVLAGTGADEVLGGYPWRYPKMASGQGVSSLMADYRRIAYRLRDRSDRPLALAHLPLSEQAEHVDAVFNKVLSTYPGDPSGLDFPVSLALYFEAKTFLPGLLLVEDKLGMTFSIETRFPFLDNDLVDFCNKLPSEFLLSGKANLTPRHNGKLLLRDLAENYLPTRGRDYEKQGFSAPDEFWFRNELRDEVYSCLAENNPLWSIISREVVLDRTQAFMRGKSNERHLIWSLLTLSRGALRDLLQTSRPSNEEQTT